MDKSRKAYKYSRIACKRRKKKHSPIFAYIYMIQCLSLVCTACATHARLYTPYNICRPFSIPQSLVHNVHIVGAQNTHAIHSHSIHFYQRIYHGRVWFEAWHTSCLVPKTFASLSEMVDELTTVKTLNFFSRSLFK